MQDPTLPSPSHRAPLHPGGHCCLSPGSSASKELLQPSPGGTCAESANTAIPKKLQNKPDALVEIYVRFHSSVRNWAPSGCSRLRGSCKIFISHRFIFFFFSFESKSLSKEIITLKWSYLQCFYLNTTVWKKETPGK